jgi:hypothetical protein
MSPPLTPLSTRPYAQSRQHLAPALTCTPPHLQSLPALVDVVSRWVSQPPDHLQSQLHLAMALLLSLVQDPLSSPPLACSVSLLWWQWLESEWTSTLLRNARTYISQSARKCVTSGVNLSRLKWLILLWHLAGGGGS